MADGKDPKKKFTTKLVMRSLTGSAGPQTVRVEAEQQQNSGKTTEKN